MMIRLLALAFVAAAAADDSRNETLDGYSLEGLQLNLSTCDLFIVALAMAEANHRGGSYTEDPHPDYAEEYAEL